MPTPVWTQLNCYKVLRVDPEASPSEISAAYRSRSKESHPDVGGSHEAQVQVNLAYEVLSDPVQRQQHDKYWAVWSEATRMSEASWRPRRRAAHWPASSHGPATASAVGDQWTRSAPPPPRHEQHTPPPRPPRSPFESLYQRVQAQVDREAQAILAERPRLHAERASSFANRFEAARSSRSSLLAFAVLASLAAMVGSIAGVHWVWILAMLTWVALANSSGSVVLGATNIGLRDTRWREKAVAAAAADVDRELNKGIELLRTNLGNVASLQALLSRSSTFDDSEEQVARRIAGALFLMGYQPLTYDPDGRMLLFSAGEEKILVRYRHRSGAETNISYVKRMANSMRVLGVARGYLFCTPGLSANGAKLARQCRITWYSLETMNRWVQETCSSSYAGPAGDILSALSNLLSFLGRISISIPQRASSTYRRR